VPIEDPQALAQAITKLATSPGLRARYGKAARELVVTKLSSRIIGELIVHLYNDMTTSMTI
jgi:glycosyltransferase involved in cell wall biosynthesis